MLKMLLPNLYISSCEKIPTKKLLENGIKVLMVDIDNTLITLDTVETNENVMLFLDKMRKANIKVVLVSNNIKSRVSTFASNCDCDYYSFALKPYPYVFRKVLKDYGIKSDELAIIGDQLFTDILGGKYVKCYTVLCEPIVANSGFITTRVFRILENMTFNHFDKKGWLVKGDFDDETM